MRKFKMFINPKHIREQKGVAVDLWTAAAAAGRRPITDTLVEQFSPSSPRKARENRSDRIVLESRSPKTGQGFRSTPEKTDPGIPGIHRK